MFVSRYSWACDAVQSCSKFSDFPGLVFSAEKQIYLLLPLSAHLHGNGVILKIRRKLSSEYS